MIMMIMNGDDYDCEYADDGNDDFDYGDDDDDDNDDDDDRDHDYNDDNEAMKLLVIISMLVGSK